MSEHKREFRAPEGDVLANRVEHFSITTDDEPLQRMLSHLWRCLSMHGGTVTIDTPEDDSDVYRFSKPPAMSEAD